MWVEIYLEPSWEAASSVSWVGRLAHDMQHLNLAHVCSLEEMLWERKPEMARLKVGIEAADRDGERT